VKCVQLTAAPSQMQLTARTLLIYLLYSHSDKRQHINISAVIDSNLRQRNRNTAQNRIEIESAILVTGTFDFY